MDHVVLGEFNLWLSRKSIKEVEPLTDELLVIQNLIGQPVLVAFVDFDGTGIEYPSEETKQLAVEES